MARQASTQERKPKPPETLPEAPPAREADGPQAAPEPQERPERALPTARSGGTGRLEEKMIVLYGPAGVGKSTLASEFGDVFFLECEPGLNDLEVYKESVTSWPEFCDWTTALKKAATEGSFPYEWVCVDTLDMAATYCSAHTNAKLGVIHESDLEWGKGWSVARNELQRWLGKLAALPGGLILVSHSQEIDIKTRNRTLTKTVPTLPKGPREVALNMADLVLLVDWEDGEDEERRVIKTKPSAFWEAKERGREPKLPAEIDWPLGSGFEVIKDAWYAK